MPCVTFQYKSGITVRSRVSSVQVGTLACVCEISRCIAWSRWGNASTFMGLEMVQHPENDCQNVYLCPRIKECSVIFSEHYFMLREGSLRTIGISSEEEETPLCDQKSTPFMPIIGKLI